MESKFDSVQRAAERRVAPKLNTHELARQIIAESGKDARIAYEFLDCLSSAVTRGLQA